jgi:hypothetical protein
MTTIEQRRAWVLTKVLAGELEVLEAADLLGLSVRLVWRLKRRFADEGPAGLVHGNRGRHVSSSMMVATSSVCARADRGASRPIARRWPISKRNRA